MSVKLYILSAAFLRRQHRRRKVLWEIVRPGLGLHPTPERYLQLGPGGDQQQALTERSTLQVEHALVLKPNQQTPHHMLSDVPRQDFTKCIFV